MRSSQSKLASVRSAGPLPSVRVAALAVALASVCVPAQAQDVVQPHASWSQLTTGNGYGFAVYDGDRGRLTHLLERPYSERSPGVVTRNVAYDAYFGVRVQGRGQWLGELPVTTLEYALETATVRAEQDVSGLRTETFTVAPWDHASASVVLALRLTNTTRLAMDDVAAYTLLNFHLGAGAPQPGTAGERITWDAGNSLYAETGPSGLTLRYVPIGDVPTHHGASPSNPYPIGKAGGTLVDVDDSAVRDDAVAGFQWNAGRLEPGESRWVGVLVTTSDATTARRYLASRTPDAVIADEMNAWNAWRVTPPAGLTARERQAWRVSESVLRMAQVRETGAGRGQILASLPPGIWSITWARDMSYAVAALARMGHTAEASLGIDFFRGARVGDFTSYVGRAYPISVVRYYGDGGEWSDSDANGPNVEFDGFGLALWAARLSGRSELDGVTGDLLRSLVDGTGLIKPDSSIWETHWNGHQQRFAYTSITAAHALCLLGDATNARSIRDALLTRVRTPQGGLGASYEQVLRGEPAKDAAVLDAINWGLINPRGDVARVTVDTLWQLRTAAGRGIARNDDGGGYDMQEWLFIDLRLASAMRRMGRTAEADALLAWVTQQAFRNKGLVPELFHEQTADYTGAIPMVGFGGGAYVHALLDRVAPESRDTGCFPDESITIPVGPDGGAGGGGGGGGSGSGSTERPADVQGAVARVEGVASGTGSRFVCAARPGAVDGGAGFAWLTLLGIGWAARRGPRRSALVGLLAGVLAACRPAAGYLPTDTGTGSDARGDSAVAPDGFDAAGNTEGGENGEGGTGSEGGLEAGRDAGPETRADVQPFADVLQDDVVVVASADDLPVRECVQRFRYDLGRQATRVSVAGEWNMFSTTASPMRDGLYSNVYRSVVPVPSGSYGYKFVADGDWQLDPSNGMTYYVGGVENSRVDVLDCARPVLDVLRTWVDPDRTIHVVLQYVDGRNRAGMDRASLAASVDRAALPGGEITVDPDTAQVEVRHPVSADGKYTFRFTLADRGGRTSPERIVPMWVEPEPFSWTDGNMYFVFTDRFRNGDTSNDSTVAGVDMRANYQGGDFRGVLRALQDGYFDRLGVRSIWLSPVNQNTNTAGLGTGGHLYTGYHGYWVTAPRTTEDHFGSLDDLRAVTQEAHRRGIRVVLDLVNNQLHTEHPYYRDHRDWFNGDGTCTCGGPNCDWDTHRLDCWFTNYLPDVNWTRMPAVDQMIADALWWASEADVDGFRCDAVKHMQHIASTTLRARLHQEFETGNARTYLVGETFTGNDDGGRGLIAQFLSDRELHGQFDFPLFWAIDYAFAQNGGSMADLDASVSANERFYGGATMSPFLGNHDVTRFLSRAAGQIASDSSAQAWSAPPSAPNTDAPYNKLYLAWVFLLTQPGVPLIYYGDEIGLPGTADPDNRRMMRFGAELSPRETGLLERVRTVAQLRAQLPGLRRGARRTLLTDTDGYVYARGAEQSLVVVALNRGTTARTVRVTFPPELGAAGTLTDRLGGGTVTVSGNTAQIPLTAGGAAIYTR